MSDAPAPALSDADKLLAVCSRLWNTGEWFIHTFPADGTIVVTNKKGRAQYFYPDSLNSLREVLLALRQHQRLAFTIRCGDKFGIDFAAFLAAEPTQILTALHRAVCPE